MTMNNPNVALAVVILIALAVDYLAFSFICMTLNPMDWDLFMRGLSVACLFIVLWIIARINNE